MHRFAQTPGLQRKSHQIAIANADYSRFGFPASLPKSDVQRVMQWLKQISIQLRAADLRELPMRRRALTKDLLSLVDVKPLKPGVWVPLVLQYVGWDDGGEESPDARYARLKRWVEAQPSPQNPFTALEPSKRDRLLRWLDRYRAYSCT